MMINLILLIHWIFDFVLQSSWMAKNKSSSNIALFTHVAIYSLPWLLLFGWEYSAINGCFHLIIDYFTSRITKKLWEQKRVHNFFVIIGLDQMLHLICLFSTIGLINTNYLIGVL